jgi:hypothetical protein
MATDGMKFTECLDGRRMSFTDPHDHRTLATMEVLAWT